MALLQYRPIDSPDFGTALRALQVAGSSFNDGIGAVRGTLDMFRNQQTQAADQEVLMRALRQQSADGLSSSLADGSLLSGLNPNRISAGVLTGLQDQVGTRLNQDRTRQALEVGAQGLTEGRYNFGRTQDLNTRSDNAREAINAIAEASQRGDTAAVQQLRNQYADVLGNLSGDQAIGLAKDSQGLVRGDLQQRTGEFGLGRDKYNLSIDQRNDREGRDAESIANRVLRMAASPEDARAALESMSGLGDNVRAAATRLVQGAFPGTYGPIAAGAPSGGGGGGNSAPSAQGTAGTQNGNVYDTSYQFAATPRPITSMSIGDVLDHQQTMRSTQGHSPLGAFQINKQTLEEFGPKVLGKDWKSQNFDADAQNKIGEAIFNQRKGRDLTQTWAALTDTRPGAYKDLTWDEMRNQISQAEVGRAVGRGANQRLQSDFATADVLTRAMQDNTAGINTDYGQTVSDNRDLGSLVGELTGEGGSFAGGDRAVVARELKRVMDEGKVNAATAAAVLRRNTAAAPVSALDSVQDFFRRVGSPARSTPVLGNGLRLNDEGVDAAIQSFRNGTAIDNFQTGAERGQVAQQIQSAQTAYDEAAQQYRAVAARAQTQPGLAAQLPRYEARMNSAQLRLNAIREAQRALPQLSGEFQRTVPEPVATSRGGDASRTTEILRNAASGSGPVIPIPEERARSRGINW